MKHIERCKLLHLQDLKLKTRRKKFKHNVESKLLGLCQKFQIKQKFKKISELHETNKIPEDT